jgi:preprotein translocase SecE subunit
VAKTRAQRKAEQRRRQAERARKGQSPADEARAQHDTQVPESADVAEAELAEHGVDLDQLRGSAPAPSRADVGRPSEVEEAPAELAEAPAEPAGPAEVAPPPDKISRRARRAEERERKQRAKESERRRAPREAPAERQRGGVLGFFASCWAELKRVQWPDRETLIQASAITLIFIAIMAAYLGILDGIFNWLVQRIL